MIEVKLHTPIASEGNGWLYCLGEENNGVFSLDFVQRLFADHPDEQDFKFNIHCPGGEVEEGLAIYDALRTSGKNIYMNIEGACHSMAVTMLLAAPYENRTANPNCRALIHKVWTCATCGTADELEAAAEQVRSLQNSILDIYADRTTTEREELERILNEEKERTATELLKWGFISKINPYNTNIKNKKMANKIIQEITNFLGKLKNEVENVMNYVFYGENGEELFRTEREDDFLEVGMRAEPDGDFDIGERIVVIRDGVITEIREKRDDERDEELNNLREQLDAANAEVSALREQLAQATNLLNEAKKHITSNGKIGNRIGATADNKNNSEMTSAERKEAVKNKLKK